MFRRQRRLPQGGRSQRQALPLVSVTGGARLLVMRISVFSSHFSTSLVSVPAEGSHLLWR